MGNCLLFLSWGKESVGNVAQGRRGYVFDNFPSYSQFALQMLLLVATFEFIEGLGLIN